LRAVVALGGNALIQRKQRGTAEEQLQNAALAGKQIARLIKEGHQIVISHGNGPQVGNLLIQQERAKSEAPPMPLDTLTAMTQGQIGYMIQQALANALLEDGLSKEVVTVITRVVVKRNDRAFKNSTKPVGPFYSKSEAEQLRLNRKYEIKEVLPEAQRPFRRVVPSPEPLEILERQVIGQLLDAGVVVIAGGGGGIPVVKKGRGLYDGIGAVIDKDLAAAKIAENIEADTLLILTDVDSVKLNYRKKNERSLRSLTLTQARKYVRQGQFLGGSMEPKVLACVRFLEGGGKTAIIASLGEAVEAVKGRAGTHFTR
jgi:carbamate kinase